MVKSFQRVSYLWLARKAHDHDYPLQSLRLCIQAYRLFRTIVVDG